MINGEQTGAVIWWYGVVVEPPSSVQAWVQHHPLLVLTRDNYDISYCPPHPWSPPDADQVALSADDTCNWYLSEIGGFTVGLWGAIPHWACSVKSPARDLGWQLVPWFHFTSQFVYTNDWHVHKAGCCSMWWSVVVWRGGPVPVLSLSSAVLVRHMTLFDTCGSNNLVVF